MLSCILGARLDDVPFRLFDNAFRQIEREREK